MSISVCCPQGHVLQVKDKYGGKRGLCPHCGTSVKVPLPPLVVSDDEIVILVGEPLDTPSGISLLGKGEVFHSLVRRCPKCLHHVHVPANNVCPNCNAPVTHW